MLKSDCVNNIHYFLDCGDLMLASGSQDSSVRVWRIVIEQASDQSSNDIESEIEDLMLTSNIFTAIWKGKTVLCIYK